jgi:hypothetical protein
MDFVFHTFVPLKGMILCMDFVPYNMVFQYEFCSWTEQKYHTYLPPPHDQRTKKEGFHSRTSWRWWQIARTHAPWHKPYSSLAVATTKD